MKLKLLNIVAVGALFITGCSQDLINFNYKSSIEGEWLSKGSKRVSNTILAKVLYKEKFLKNGDLYSSKWFNFKDSKGRDLGEFYITKLFKWNKNSNKISTKFVRCQTGITKPLKATKLGYSKLKYTCARSVYNNGRVTVKEYKLIDNKLILGNREYIKIRD